MNHHTHPAPNRTAASQRGVVLLFSLIALVIMLIGAVALVRSFHGSLFTAGNIGFKRDMQNQSERAVVKVLAKFRTGSLNTAAARALSSTADNYSAVMLPVNSQGIPTALQTDETFAAVGVATNDITPLNESSLPPNQIQSIRYVVDRLCSSTGNETTLSSSGCMLADNSAQTSADDMTVRGAERSLGGKAGAVPQSVVYRLSIKVTGPRNTQSFFQSTFTVPS